MTASRLHVVLVYAVAVAMVGAFIIPSQSRNKDAIKRCRLSRMLRQHDPTLVSRGRYAIPENHEQRQYWTLPRLYVGRSRNMQGMRTLSTGAMVPLLPEQTHYLMNVMRIMSNRRTNRQQQRPIIDGDNDAKIRIFNGEDGEWLAKVHASTSRKDQYAESSKNRHKKGVRSLNDRMGDGALIAECILQLRAQDYDEDDRPWVLFVPLKKQPRMKIMIEKCTELGVGRLIPVASDRMEREASIALLGSRGNDNIFVQENNDLRIDKLELHSIEASEQCERLGVPMITYDVGLPLSDMSSGAFLTVRIVVENWCRAWDAQKEVTARRVLLICRERGSGEHTVPVLKALHENINISYLVGPEGGWSAEEELLFDKICSKYAGQDEMPVRCVSLGSSILRAETACLMAVGAWALTATTKRN